jgi:hypothetical protein
MIGFDPQLVDIAKLRPGRHHLQGRLWSITGRLGQQQRMTVLKRTILGWLSDDAYEPIAAVTSSHQFRPGSPAMFRIGFGILPIHPEPAGDEVDDIVATTLGVLAEQSPLTDDTTPPWR